MFALDFNFDHTAIDWTMVPQGCPAQDILRWIPEGNVPRFDAPCGCTDVLGSVHKRIWSVWSSHCGNHSCVFKLTPRSRNNPRFPGTQPYDCNDMSSVIARYLRTCVAEVKELTNSQKSDFAFWAFTYVYVRYTRQLELERSESWRDAFGADEALKSVFD